MNESILELKNICKTYDKVTVLDDVSIHVNRGDIYGLLGNNGAGKTTLMRVIVGHTRADQGEIKLFDSKGFEEARIERKRIGVLIEEPGFFGGMTARENLEYFRIQFGIPGKHVIDKTLELVGLENCGRTKYAQFSTGMKQRLGIGLSLMHTPELLVLDEPINGLDPAGIIEIREALIRINQERNTTILISSHILAEMANIATKYGFLSHGKLVEEIEANQLRKKCNTYIDIVVEDINQMCVLLENDLGYKEYKVYPDHHIHVFEANADNERICELAVNHHLGLTGITKRSVNLENYYMNLVEGR